MRTIAFAVILAAGSTSAQDMLGVTWSGSIYAVDSFSGAAQPVAAGIFGHEAMARDDQGTLWTVARTLLGAPSYFLTRLDTTTFDQAIVVQIGDARALADGGGGILYAAEFFPGDYRLMRIDTTTGVRSLVGATGTTVQAMTMHNGALYAWNVDEGLGTIDLATGVFTDVGPFGGGSIQWLDVRSDGQLIGGNYEFFTIDPGSGAYLPYATGTLDFRGVARSQFALPIGSGCAGVELRATGTLQPGSFVATVSTGYPSTGAIVGIAGALLLGTSSTSYQNVPLPLDLDPLLGTTGCSLYTSVDASQLGLTTGSATPSFFLPILLPAAVAGQTFFVQHAAIDLNGQTYWSNGVRLQIGF
ncbi:MAG: hypothetical protein KAI24_12775 [Planctomycetes bacterium]|nr:hypothetical protein [Planctomycetota bacterium]